MQGSSLAAYLAGVPCPNCGNERGMELHAVFSTGNTLLSGRTYHCFSLNCPVCHHGNSWPADNAGKTGKVQSDHGELPEGPAIGQINLLMTRQHRGQLGFAERIRFDRMLVKLGMGGLREKLSR
jgi:hypothetical protein